MELTAEQIAAKQAEELQTKAILAWGGSPHDAVEEGDYGERLTRTRVVFVDAYTAGYQQARADILSGGSRLTFGDALVLNAAVSDLMQADLATHLAADRMRKALSGLIEAGKSSR